MPLYTPLSPSLPLSLSIWSCLCVFCVVAKGAVCAPHPLLSSATSCRYIGLISHAHQLNEKYVCVASDVVVVVVVASLKFSPWLPCNPPHTCYPQSTSVHSQTPNAKLFLLFHLLQLLFCFLHLQYSDTHMLSCERATHTHTHRDTNTIAIGK